MALNRLGIDGMDTRYLVLVAAIERAINEADPIGLLEIGAPTDEYGPETFGRETPTSAFTTA